MFVVINDISRIYKIHFEPDCQAIFVKMRIYEGLECLWQTKNRSWKSGFLS